jgi:hypothetical protein
VDGATFARVQDVLGGRRIAGDRAWRNNHYLKGSVFCGRCGSRLGYGHSTGRGGSYSYFFCLGRAKKELSATCRICPSAQWREPSSTCGNAAL